ncbi:MAG: FAD-binding oxidoreductase [Acidimicrobiales bacterium]
MPRFGTGRRHDPQPASGEQRAGRPSGGRGAGHEGADPGADERRPSHYDRRAELIRRTPLTSTGTVRLTFRVVDGRPFEFFPGYFVSVESEIEGVGRRHSPYCILSRPGRAPVFELIVRLVEGGDRSGYLGSLAVGDLLAFRGPGGHSMLPRDDSRDLVLLATGVGIGPLLSLTGELLAEGFPRPIRLFWGLRLEEDMCLTDELDALADDHADFSYRISLSQPGPGWRGLRGRLTESVPPLLGSVGGSDYRLVGNGAMTEEMAAALGDMGVGKEVIAREAYFNGRHRPDPTVMSAIHSRFVASDLLAPSAFETGDLFRLDRPLGGRPRPPRSDR